MTSQSVPHSRASALAALLLLVLAVFAAVGPTPAHADASCPDADGQAFDFTRLRMELEEIGGDGQLLLDTADADVTCSVPNGNALSISKGGTQVLTDSPADAPNFHLSCSEDLATYTITYLGVDYSVVSYIFDSEGPSGYTGFCQEFPGEDPDPASASITVGACVFTDDASTYPATYTLDPGDEEGPFVLVADEVEIDSDLAAGTDLDAGSHAPGTVLRIYEDGAESDLAGATVPEATCEPDPEPEPDPATAVTVVACEPTGDLGTAVATITNPDGLTVEAELVVTQTDDVGVLTASDSVTSDETSFTLSVPVVDGPYTLTVLLDGEVADVVEGTSECETEVLDEVLEPEPEPEEEPTVVLDEVIENPAPEPVELAATGAPAIQAAGAALVAMLLGGLALVTDRRRRTG